MRLRGEPRVQFPDPGPEGAERAAELLGIGTDSEALPSHLGQHVVAERQAGLLAQRDVGGNHGIQSPEPGGFLS